MQKTRIPRRASRNLTPWQRFKRWLYSFSPEEREWKRIVKQIANQPHIHEALHRMANEEKEGNNSGH